jgi:hypothetical protein
MRKGILSLSNSLLEFFYTSHIQKMSNNRVSGGASQIFVGELEWSGLHNARRCCRRCTSGRRAPRCTALKWASVPAAPAQTPITGQRPISMGRQGCARIWDAPVRHKGMIRFGFLTDQPAGRTLSEAAILRHQPNCLRGNFEKPLALSKDETPGACHNFAGISCRHAGRL